MDKEKLNELKENFKKYVPRVMMFDGISSQFLMTTNAILKSRAGYLRSSLETAIASFDDYKYHVTLMIDDDELKERYSGWRRQRRNFKRNVKNY